MSEPIKHVNDLGQIRYQPHLVTGESLNNTMFGDRTWNTSFGWIWPVLYRSKSRAIRVASREEYRRAKDNWQADKDGK